MAATKHRKKTTTNDRVSIHRKHVKKMTNMLKILKDMTREGALCDDDLKLIAHKIRVIREINQTRIIIELQREVAKEEMAS